MVQGVVNPNNEAVVAHQSSKRGWTVLGAWEIIVERGYNPVVALKQLVARFVGLCVPAIDHEQFTPMSKVSSHPRSNCFELMLKCKSKAKGSKCKSRIALRHFPALNTLQVEAREDISGGPVNTLHVCVGNVHLVCDC